MEPGIYHDLNFAEYRAIDAVNYSRLKLMDVSPLMYAANPRKFSPAMTLGSAVHCRALEPDRFPLEYVVYTGPTSGKGSTIARREFKEAMAESGQTVLTAAEYETATSIGRAVRGHPRALELIETTRHEVSAVWRDHDSGVQCMGRMDMASDTILADLKTCRDPSPREFGRVCANFKYVHQLAFYNSGLGQVWAPKGQEFRSTYLIAAQNVEPFDVCVYQVSLRDQAECFIEVGTWLEQYVECRDRQSWPGLAPTEVLELELPPWAYAETEINMEGLCNE